MLQEKKENNNTNVLKGIKTLQVIIIMSTELLVFILVGQNVVVFFCSLYYVSVCVFSVDFSFIAHENNNKTNSTQRKNTLEMNIRVNDFCGKRKNDNVYGNHH